MPGYLMFQIPAEWKNAHGEMYTPGGMPDPQMGPRGSASYTHPHVGIVQRMSCPHDCLLRDPCVPVSLDLQHCHLGKKECSHVCTWPSLGSVLEGFPKAHPTAGWQLWSSSPGQTAQPGSGSPGLPSAPQPLRPCPRGPFLTYRSSPGCSQVPGRVGMGGCSLGHHADWVTMQTAPRAPQSAWASCAWQCMSSWSSTVCPCPLCPPLPGLSQPEEEEEAPVEMAKRHQPSTKEVS